MKHNLDIHNYDKKLESALKKLDKINISEQNKITIKEFIKNII